MNKMKGYIGALSLVGGLLIFPQISNAQEDSHLVKQPRIEKVENKKDPQQREAEREQRMIEQKAQFVKTIDVTEKEADKYFSIQKEFRGKFKQLTDEKNALHKELRQADGLSDKDLKKKSERLLNIDVELAKLKSAKFDKEISLLGVRKALKAQNYGPKRSLKSAGFKKSHATNANKSNLRSKDDMRFNKGNHVENKIDKKKVDQDNIKLK